MPVSSRITSWFLLVIPVFVHAQNQKKNAGRKDLLSVKHTSDFIITGNGSAVNWNNADWIRLPRRTGDDTARQTKLKLLYSDSGIYCLYQCEDHKITASLNEDFADLYNEDVVEAFFHTDDKLPFYFEYELSPLNHELALLVPNIKGDFLGWLPWHYEGNRRTRHASQIFKKDGSVDAWTTEFFIPYALLKPMAKVPPQKGTRWRANFYRIDYDKGVSTWQWQMVRGENFHDYERFGTILFN